MPNSPRNTYDMMGHYAVCQVSYALEREPWLASTAFRDQIDALHDTHHKWVEREDPEVDDLIEGLDKLVLALWAAEFGSFFVMKNRASQAVTGAEGQRGIRLRSDPRRINPPVMGLDWHV